MQSTTVLNSSSTTVQPSLRVKLGAISPAKSKSNSKLLSAGGKPPSSLQTSTKDRSPDTDWELWYRPATSTGHHVSESPAEQQAKRVLLRNVQDASPKTPYKLDAARLKNVLLELNVHYRVAALLPVLLAPKEADELDFLGENVSRALGLIRLQAILATTILGENDPAGVKSNVNLTDSDTDTHDSQDSELVEKDSCLSTKHEQESQEERLKNRLSLAATSRLFSFKEAFFSLCIAFRDNSSYELLTKAEKYVEKQLTEMKILPVVRKLTHLTAEMMQILLNSIETTPFQSREVQKVIAHMTELNTATEGTMRLLWDDFKKSLDESRTEQEHLAKTVSKNQKIITERLRELYEVRLKAQARIHRQVEDDNGPHRKKLSKINAETGETDKLVDERNKQFLRHEKDYLKQMRDAKIMQQNIEIVVLERCVAVKTEIMALQDRGEILREYLRKDLQEESILEVEMNELIKDRQECDERRRLAEAEALRRNNAATKIQKVYRGYIVRKKLKKKKGKKGKKKGKSKGGKTKPAKKKTPSVKKKGKK